MNRQPGCPALTAEQTRAVDRAMIGEFHIDLVQMMENAGRNMFASDPLPLVRTISLEDEVLRPNCNHDREGWG
jgi:hypothetical protein